MKQNKQEVHKEVIASISMRECIKCKTNLDNDLGRKDWHIPLCHKHRLESLKEMTDGVLGGKHK